MSEQRYEVYHCLCCPAYSYDDCYDNSYCGLDRGIAGEPDIIPLTGEGVSPPDTCPLRRGPVTIVLGEPNG